MSDSTDLRLEPLRNEVPIADEKGFPTPAFIRQWQEMVGSLEFTERADRQQITNQAQQLITVRETIGKRPDILYVSSAADLAPYLSGDAYVLPGKLVVPVNTVDLGDKALEVSAGTVINGLAKGAFVSSNASGMLRATAAVASSVVVLNVELSATAGPALALEGPIDQTLTLDAVSIFSPTAGTITGYDVSNLTNCFLGVADGVTYDGATNKISVRDTLFSSITTYAIRFAATLNCSVANIESGFFKYDLPGVGVEAQAGYTVGRGLITGCLKFGSADILSGISPADVGWTVKNVQGVRDSSVLGAFMQDAGEETTPIAAIDTPVKATLTTTASSYNERFTHANNQLTYTGLDPVTVTVYGASSMGSPDPDQEVRLLLALNGTLIPASRMRATLQGSGAHDPVSVSGVLEMTNGDYVELYVENTTSDADITMEDSSLSVTV